TGSHISLALLQSFLSVQIWRKSVHYWAVHNYSLKRTAADRRFCYHAARGSGRLAQALGPAKSRSTYASLAYRSAFLPAPASFSSWLTCTPERFTRAAARGWRATHFIRSAR